MPTGSGLLTERERAALRERDTDQTELRERIRDRLDALERDLELLATHEPSLFERIEATVDQAGTSDGTLADETPQTLGALGMTDISEKRKSAVYAARDYIRANEEATKLEIIRTIMPIYPYTYDVSDAHRQGGGGESEEWFEEIIEPGLEALPSVEPAEADNSWEYTG